MTAVTTVSPGRSVFLATGNGNRVRSASGVRDRDGSRGVEAGEVRVVFFPSLRSVVTSY